MTAPGPPATIKKTAYRDAGVDIDAGAALVGAIKPAARATARPGSLAGLGGFGALFDLKAAGYSDPILVATTDGVGTKLRLAIDLGVHDSVGIDLVAMCVNDLVVQGAEPLFFLDYFATGRLAVDTAARVVGGIAAGCRTAGCALIGGETAEMPGMYDGCDYDLAGFAVGAVERDGQVDGSMVGVGDVVLGLPSSGAHSNGYSLVRRIVADAGLAWDDPCPFEAGTGLGAALLTPTTIYVGPVLAALRAAPGGIRAMAHITGGGLTENLPRVLPDGLRAELSLTAWTMPPVFRWLAATGGVEPEEMLRTFNCGIGYVLLCAPGAVPALSAALAAAGTAPLRIGQIGAAAPSSVDRSGAAIIYSGQDLKAWLKAP